MNINITTFHNPFSFFCFCNDGKKHESPEYLVENTRNTKIKLSEVNHGQYVAVMWKNKWTRGLVTMESQLLIWLLDYGIYMRPNEKTVYIILPVGYKNIPTKIFEASIHGVVPIDKELSAECQIQNKISEKWTTGANERAQSLIATSTNIHFVPIALLTTKHNDIVLGDLYLEFSNNRIMNIVDQLETWPYFLEKNQLAYIDNLSSYYTSRKLHRACLLKPVIAERLPLMSTKTTLDYYSAICDATPQFETVLDYCDTSEDGSTVIDYPHEKNNDVFKVTAEEIEKYSNMYITINKIQYNVLNILTNKIRDFNMCEKYKDYDKKGVGRGSYKTRPKDENVA